MADFYRTFSLREHAGNAPFFVIAGPCVLQDLDEALLIAGRLKDVTSRLGLPAIFKASFDKANRTSGEGQRGPGMAAGLEILAEVKRRTGLPLLTDIHLPDQTDAAARVCDVLQIPAFLCRQTDLLQAAARVCRTINVKKGQFLSPWDTRHIVTKVKAVRPDAELILTERGTSFGYGNLVVDMRCLPIMRQWADAVVFDATHSLQLPGAAGDRTGGQREYIPCLSRAAMATGSIDGIFLEVHPEPSRSPSDADNILPLDRLEPLLIELLAVRNAVGRAEPAPSGTAMR